MFRLLNTVFRRPAFLLKMFAIWDYLKVTLWWEFLMLIWDYLKVTLWWVFLMLIFSRKWIEWLTIMLYFQLLHGAPKEVLSELYLDKKPEDYHFVNQGGVFEVSLWYLFFCYLLLLRFVILLLTNGLIKERLDLKGSLQVVKNVRFYSLLFGQVVASMYQPKSHFHWHEKLFWWAGLITVLL